MAAFPEAALRNRRGPYGWFARTTAPMAGASHTVVREWPKTMDTGTQTDVRETYDVDINTESRTAHPTAHTRVRTVCRPVERQDGSTQMKTSTATVGT